MEYSTYGKLENGNRIRLQGYLMEVKNVSMEEVNGKLAVRFNGHCLEDCDIKGTIYDGGRYGAYPGVRIEIIS